MPVAHELEIADTVELCQELLQLTNSLEKGQTASVHFMTWKRRAEVIRVMTERYGEHADLRKIEFCVFH